MAMILSQEEIDALLECDSRPTNLGIRSIVDRKISELREEHSKLSIKMKAIQGLNLLAHTDDFTIKDYMSIINDLIDCLEYKISHCQSFGDNISNKKAEKEFLEELRSFKLTLMDFDLKMDIKRENREDE
ncbi:hypothetical protein F207_068 [Campylobacter phage F207]|uniref:Uncharacterized protein n=1 Tax=Campylobacter phage F207 TaxID=2794360 RepID=A0A7T3N1Q5_9CAUD|nr:hypothetical protein F207_068 [Campylobacter phage F207]